ncbi:MAG: hypothetical protein EBQ85_01885, partial [Proteobacteria bacterium]|nr:hypothetical protein [Pseudomonadota bacterium]
SPMPQYEAGYHWKSWNMVSFQDISGFPFTNIDSCARDSILCPLKKYLSQCDFNSTRNNPNAVTKVEDFVGRVLKLSDGEIDSSCTKLNHAGAQWLVFLKHYVKALRINHFEESLKTRQDFQKIFTENTAGARSLRVGTIHQGYSCLWPTQLGSDYTEDKEKQPINNDRYQNGRPKYQYFVDTEIDKYLAKWSSEKDKPLAPCMAHEIDERPELTTWKSGDRNNEDPKYRPEDNEYQLRYFPDFSADKFRRGLKKVRDWQEKYEPSVTRTVPLIRYTSPKLEIRRVTTFPPEKLPQNENWKEEMKWLIFDEAKPGQERIPLFECRTEEKGPILFLATPIAKERSKLAFSVMFLERFQM